MSPILQTLANGSAYGYRTLAAAGAEPAFESISTVLGNGSATTITLSSIPSTYKHLQLRVIQYDNGGNNSVVRVNGDSGTNYARHRLIGNGVEANAERAASQTSWRIGFYPALNPGCVSIIDIFDYKSTTKNKTMQAFSGWSYQPADTKGEVMLDSGLWMNTAAITSISFISTNAFNSDSVFSLYGIK
jgi:hypothetical protein